MFRHVIGHRIDLELSVGDLLADLQIFDGKTKLFEQGCAFMDSRNLVIKNFFLACGDFHVGVGESCATLTRAQHFHASSLMRQSKFAKSAPCGLFAIIVGAGLK